MSRGRVTKPRTGVSDDAAARLLAAVRAIPRGQVRSYAQVAAVAGLPGHARRVARALAGSDAATPWHRVLRADGRIAFAPGSAAADEQARRLRSEGVEVIAGRVGVRWRPAPARDLWLWGGQSAGPV